MRVSKWGKSLAIRLPKSLVDQLGLREGNELNVAPPDVSWSSRNIGRGMRWTRQCRCMLKRVDEQRTAKSDKISMVIR